MELIKTWIEGLDETLGGGLPDKSVILVTGEPGSGYDIFAQQVLHQCAVKEGKVAYVTTFRSPDTVREDLKAFGWKVSALEKTGRWTFIDVHTPKALQVFRRRVPSKIRGGCWTLVDSLSYLILTQKFQSVLEAVGFLLNNVRKHGGIHFLLLTQSMHDPQTEIAMQHLVDGVMEFTACETAGRIDRRIRIKKMRRAVYAPRLIPFNLTNRGIIIETAIRVA
ncbi:hypothetical protein GWO13_08025 [Candidatus Bathyarchaeota archaeon]|nr:hypothetical protein [Candidatus Bathyarchaeota archaeon]